MDRVLLDTDVIIENFKGNETILSKIKDLKNEKVLFCISPVSIAEVYAGLRSKEEEMVMEFFSSLSCLLIDQTIAVKAGGRRVIDSFLALSWPFTDFTNLTITYAKLSKIRFFILISLQ